MSTRDRYDGRCRAPDAPQAPVVDRRPPAAVHAAPREWLLLCASCGRARAQSRSVTLTGIMGARRGWGGGGGGGGGGVWWLLCFWLFVVVWGGGGGGVGFGGPDLPLDDDERD